MGKIGRNEDCPCGSSLKYKFCCGGNGKPDAADQPKKKILNQLGLNRCFLKLVKDAGGSLDIACEDIDGIPKEEVLSIKHNAEDDSFHFEAVKVKKNPIIQPDKRIQVARA